MTGPEHYRQAQWLLEALPGLSEDSLVPEWIGRAQVHATLALAAATAATAVELGHDTGDWTAALRGGAS